MRANMWDLARTSRVHEHHRQCPTPRGGEAWPPNLEYVPGVHNRDGCLLVASDGACSNQQSDPRFRRCGSGLFCGKNHPIQMEEGKSNTQPNCTVSRDQISNEMGIWAWCSQELLTDSSLVARGCRNLEQDGKRKMTTQNDDASGLMEPD